MVAVSGPGGDRRWVYFIQSGTDGPIKIGETNDLDARLRTHQIGNPEDLRIIGKAPVGLLSERALHHRFSAHRIRGEWFHAAPEILALASFWAAPPPICPCCKNSTQEVSSERA